MKHLKLFFALFAMLALGVGNAWGAEKTITLTYSDFGLTTSYAQKTATIDGIGFTVNQGYKGSGNVIQMNSSKGAGVLYNTTSIAGLKSITVNVSSGSKTYTITSGTAQTPSGNSQTGTATKTFSIPSGDTYFQLKVSGASYFSSIVITYDDSNSGGETPGTGGETPEPEPEPGTGGTGTINFNSNAVKINAASVTGDDNLGNTWTITTVGTTSYTANNAYYQVGSGSKPATSITFTTTLPSEGNITAFSAKFGGFSGTAGTVTLKVDDTSVGTGSLNAANDVTVSNSSQATGKKLTVTVTGIAKGVKVYNISYTYTTSSGGSEPETPATELANDQFAWSAATAEATMGTTNTLPTLTNTLGLTVTYDSSNKDAATIAADGTITLVAPGTTTISAKFAGGEVSGTKYAAKTVTYTLTVKQLVSCADIYTLADDATFVLKDFVVTYVNGDYTYIKDATGYGVIYKNSYGLQAGDQVASGKLEGKKDTYKGLVEIVPTTAAGDLNATSGTAPEPEVMTNTPTNADINKYVKFENVSFKYTNLNDTYKTNSGKLEGQTEYNIAFYNKFTSNVTFDTSKKYDVVGVVSIKDDAIEVYFISAEEVAEPTLNVEITNADFGKIAINGEAERTLTLNGSLLTKPVSLAIEGEGAEHFTLASNSVTPTDGNITDAKIKITYKPIAEGPHTATLKITSDELTAQTITLTGNAVEEYTVHFYLNGEEQTELAKTILSGNTLDALPDATSCDQINYPTFAGWASDAIAGTTGVKPTMLDLSTPITSDCNYYAVFAKGTTSSGSTTSAIMKYTGGTTTNMEDGNNATIVGLDETLFNITSTKTASGTHVGLNKGNDIRLYANKNDGNGNILTISMLDGSSITKITLDIKQEANFVVKADGKSITGADDVYTIGYPSCSIQNTTTGVTTQLHLNSITIEYTTSTTTYEYITSCAVVVPTCEIIYDYADGEGECTTDIVEKDTEYTLCATAPTKAGHTFLNWKDQNGVEYAKGATINSVTEDLTLTAQWQVNSYEVTWMSLGEEVTSNSANHNTQPTKPANPTYTCGTGKEFIGWTTQEIDGVGVPANLYTDEFPVVTKAITYYAVFASINSSTESTTHTLTPNNSWSGYKEGTITDDKGYTWSYCAAGTKTDGVCSLNLRNKDTETSYIGSPSFAANVKSIKATIVNGSASKARKVYVCSAPTLEPTTGDLGITEVAGGHSGELSLAFEGTISQFYLQVSDALQFQSIVVEVGADPYTDYTTSCPTLVTPSVEKGIFSVADDKFVQFSTGNLQYEVGTNTWSFASEQYSYVGEENINVGKPTYTGKIDMFGWSADGKFGVNPSNKNEDYYGAFQDWGTLVNEEDWYTLSADEWKYLLNTRANAKNLKQIAKVNNGEKDIVGIMLFPDAWTMPADVNVAAAYDDYFKVNIYNYTLEQWAKLEAAGAVFLPAAGRRTGGYGNMINYDQQVETNPENLNGGHYKHQDNTNIYCYYWTSTIDEDKNVSYLHNIQALGGDKYTINTGAVWGEKGRYGQSVRLVKKVTPDYTRTVTSGDYGTICLPNGGQLVGASAFSVLKMEGTTILLYEVGTTMVAGTPYVVFPNTGAKKLYVFYTDNVNAPAGEANGLYGSYTREELAPNAGYYIMLPGNRYAEVTGDRVFVAANRAYFKVDDIEDISTTAPALAPGVRRIAIGQAPQVATGMENIDASAQPVKAIINGQLFILRGEKMYDAQGKLVK